MIAENWQAEDHGIGGTCIVLMLVLFWVLVTAPQLSATPDDPNIHSDSLGLGIPVSSDSSHLRYQVYGFLLSRCECLNSIDHGHTAVDRCLVSPST